MSESPLPNYKKVHKAEKKKVHVSMCACEYVHVCTQVHMCLRVSVDGVHVYVLQRKSQGRTVLWV